MNVAQSTRRNYLHVFSLFVIYYHKLLDLLGIFFATKLRALCSVLATIIANQIVGIY